jgi:hypothetical protein
MSEPTFQFTAKDYLLTPKGQAIYAIKERDLERLEKMANRIDQQGGFYQNMGFGGAGAAIGTATSLIGLAYTQNVAVWCQILCWVILAVSFSLAVVGFVASRRERHNLQVSKQAILEEFQLLKESVHTPETGTITSSKSA